MVTLLGNSNKNPWFSIFFKKGMVLSHQGIFLVLQLDLGFHNNQENIIFDLSIQAWRLKTSFEEFAQVNRILEREEERAKLIRGIPIAHEEAVVARLALRPL